MRETDKEVIRPVTVQVAVLAAFFAASVQLCTAQNPSPGYSPLDSGITLVDMIPNQFSAEAHQDSEVNLAVNPSNITEIAASAFIPGPGICADANLSPILVSTDSGGTWAFKCVLPSINPGGGTADITLRFGPLDNVLYAGLLRWIGDPTIMPLPFDVMSTDDSFTGIMTQIFEQAAGPIPCIVDQPYLEVASPFSSDKDLVYVGINDLQLSTACNGTGQTANLELSVDAAAPIPSFNEVPLEERSTVGQDAPSARPAVAISSDGTVYAAYFGWRSVVNSVFTSDVVVAVDFAAGASFPPFHGRKDLDGNMGIRVATGRQIWWDPYGDFGQERIGSAISIAVDPHQNGVAFLAWIDDMPQAGHTLHVVRGTNSAEAWTSDLWSTTQAINPSIAVNSEGMVGLLYQQLDTSTSTPRWITHFLHTIDNFHTVTDIVLVETRADTPVSQFLPYLGDYTHLMAIGNVFYGAFAASNEPNPANFPNGVLYNRVVDWVRKQLADTSGAPVSPSIDPFYFSFNPIPAFTPCTENPLLCHGFPDWPVTIWGVLHGITFIGPLTTDTSLLGQLQSLHFPAFLNIFLDGLPMGWSAGVLDAQMSSIPAIQQHTPSGLAMTVRLNNREEAEKLINTSLVGMKLEKDGALKQQHRVDVRLALSERPYAASSEAKREPQVRKKRP